MKKDIGTEKGDSQVSRSEKEAEKHIADKTFQTSPPHAKIKSHILNFPLNTSTTCCQVVKNAAIVLVKTYRYRKDIEVLQKKLSI